jgi:hypothetical protein
VIRSAAKLSITALLVGAAACTSLPDTSGYTAATLQLKQSAVAAGAVMHAELARTAEQIPGDRNRATLTRAAADFDAAWQVTVESLAAMGRYAESVQELTGAGNHGAQSAQQLSQSVLSLAGAVGIVPGAAVAGAVVDSFALLNSAVANVRASRSLAASLAAADPIMQDVARRVTGQVDLAEQTFNALISQQQAQADIAFADVHDVDAALRQTEIAAVARAAGGGADSGLQAELTRLRDARALLAPRVAEYQAVRDAVAARERAGRDLFLATKTALQTWADSHDRLVQAVRERRPVSFESLLASSQEVRSLIERWRDL